MRAVSAAARLLRARSRARSGAPIATRLYWARPVPGFGDPRRAAADRRPGAGSARREPHRPRLHRRRRRRLGRLPDGRAAPRRLRQHPDVAASRRRPDAARRVTSPPPCAARRPTTSRRRRRSPAACRISTPRSPRCPACASSSRSGKIAFDAYLRLLKHRGIVAPAAAARSRHGVGAPSAERPDADRLLPPEPAEHEHRQADAADDGRGISTARRVLG